MRPFKNNLHAIMFRAPQELHDRLKHHTKRLGADMNALVREATLMYLDRLDEKEMFSLEAKRARENKGASVPKHRWGNVPGLGIKKDVKPFMPADGIAVVSEKLSQSFRRWAEYVEIAEDHSDRERRIEIILQDIQQRAASQAEVKACFKKFEEFLIEREDARHKPVVTVDERTTISGETD